MKTILVVDDEPRMLSAISRSLERFGFNVLQASDGREAMDLLADNTVDLTISDVFMPDVDGMEFTIRVKRRFPDAKIIAMTGGGLLQKKEVLEIARTVGASATLSKPFQLSELMDVVNEVLQINEQGASIDDGAKIVGE